jgi:RNA polymerase sigma-70 factor (ECF subfamily)
MRPADPALQPEKTEFDEAEEALLLARLRSGDERAYELVVERHAGRMLAAARRILRSDEDAQDAVQDAFLSAFKALDRFQGDSRLGTWLHRIAINAALMKLRSQKRRNEQDVQGLLPRFKDGDGHHEIAPRKWAASADAPVMVEESRALVRSMIDQLPDNYRVALVLRDMEGLSTEEVAERLGVSPNAAKIRVHRARQALRELLDPHFGEAQA